MEESAVPASPQPALRFWAVHCLGRGCSFGGWSTDPKRLEVETARPCPYDQSARAVHLERLSVMMAPEMSGDETDGGTAGQEMSTARRAAPSSLRVSLRSGGISPLDPIERRVLQGVAKLWTSHEAAWLASCSVTSIRAAVRDGHLEGYQADLLSKRRRRPDSASRAAARARLGPP